MSSCTVTGSVRLGSGVARFVPFPLTCTRALPARPALSFAAVTPAGVAARLRYANPVLVAFQHGTLPQVPPAGIDASVSGCGRPEPSKMQSA